MWRDWLQRWQDWTGDKRLEQAIHRELRRLGYAVHAGKIRDVRLAAIQRPGWVQVCQFRVETRTNDENPHSRRDVVLHGLSRDDGRQEGIDILLTEDEQAWQDRFAQWSDGLLTRR